MPDTTRNSKRTPILGCIADDVTGATDLAINLVQGGMCVVQLLAVPTVEELTEIDADAIVVALKTRSIRKDEAVSLSLDALASLREFGIERVFFKYCSTFDSTEKGNIGPVACALLEALGTPQTIFCPAFPRNGRTVYQGHLFVHGEILNESGMEQHPLNPMTDANLVRFLGKQTGREIGLVNYDELSSGQTRRKLDTLAASGCSLVITDACDDEHLELLAAAVADMPLVTGGSGIARFLPAAFRSIGVFNSQVYTPNLPTVSGRSLIISGSCSAATNNQVAWMSSKCPSWEVNVDSVLNDADAALSEVVQWAKAINETKPILIYSTAPPERVSEIQGKHGDREAAQAIEDFLAAVATAIVAELKVARLVLAGGETSGAIATKLGVRSLRIGPEICAGVPWTESLGDRPLALALKSGNFGGDDFFEKALGMLR